MQAKILLALVAAVLVAGLPEPDPDPNIDVKVDSGDLKANSYFGVVKTAGKTSFELISKIVGQSTGEKCCKVKKAFSWPVVYVNYPNGAMDVPCGGRLAGKHGTCVDGNVVCDIDNMGVASNMITFNVEDLINGQNKSIMVDLVPGSSFFDAMNIAKQMNNEFRFTSTLFQGGVSIQGIGGVETDIPDHGKWGWVWLFYNCTETCTSSLKGVSETYPNNGDIWTYRYQFSNWTTSHSG